MKIETQQEFLLQVRNDEANFTYQDLMGFVIYLHLRVDLHVIWKQILQL